MPPLKYRPAGQRAPAEDSCGTYRGYHRHYRRGEPACRACLNAVAQYNEDLRLAPGRRAVLDAEVGAYDKRHRGTRAAS